MTELKGELRDYLYKEDVETVEIPVGLFESFRQAVDVAIENETEVFFTDKFKLVNKETGKEVSKRTKQNSDKLVQVIDIDKTMESQGEQKYTRLGQYFRGIKIKIERLHFKNIEKGLAVHKDDL